MDQKTVELFSMFNEDLNMVKEEFNKQNPKLTPSMPRFAGKATWATALKRRVEAPMKVRGAQCLMLTVGLVQIPAVIWVCN